MSCAWHLLAIESSRMYKEVDTMFFMVFAMNIESRVNRLREERLHEIREQKQSIMYEACQSFNSQFGTEAQGATHERQQHTKQENCQTELALRPLNCSGTV